VANTLQPVNILYIYELENGSFVNHVVYSSTCKHSCPQCNDLADTLCCKEPIRLVPVEAATARPVVPTSAAVRGP
jgi:hypothetical protein